MNSSTDIADAYQRKYGERIYDPVANAKAIEEQNAKIARRARLTALYGDKPKRKGDR